MERWGEIACFFVAKFCTKKMDNRAALAGAQVVKMDEVTLIFISLEIYGERGGV